MSDHSITLTPAVVAGWMDDKTRLERQLAETEKALARVNQKLQAAAFLMQEEGLPASTDTPAAATGGNGAADVEDGPNMTAVIEQIANSVERPIPHDEMRRRLRELHFPESRLGNYYYTAVHRLKTKGRISVDRRKRIGRVQA